MTSTTLGQPATGVSGDTDLLATGGLSGGGGNGAVATAVEGGTRALARTGLSVRSAQFVAGVAMAAGGLLVLLAQNTQPLGRGRRREG